MIFTLFLSIFNDDILLLRLFKNYKINLGDKMSSFFDEDSQKIIINAKREMLELKHPYVGSEHLLLAILKNTSLNITKMLNDKGIFYDKFRDKLIDSVGVGNKKSEWFLFTPLLRKILSQATYSTKSNSYITPYHLLMALFQVGDGVAVHILLGMNIDLISIYNNFLSIESDIISSDKVTLLDEFGVNMNKCSLANQYNPVIGRDIQVQRLIEILSRKNKNNPLLIGEAGVGKTAIVEELVRRIAFGEVPPKLKKKIVYNVSIASLVAGTKYRGEFEERLNRIILELVSNPDIILFFDEFHTVVGAGGAEGAIDASNILKPYLARNEIRVIGATTSFEYEKFIEKDKAFDRRFQKIYIAEPIQSEVKEILLKLIPMYEKYHSISFPSDLIDSFLDLSFKCLFKGRQPDKTIDFLDEVCSYCSVKKSNFDILSSKYESKIREFELKKKQEIINHNFKKALIYKNQEMKFRSKYNEKVFTNQNQKKNVVTVKDIKDVLYNLSRAPKKEVLFKNKRKFANHLKKIMFGQSNLIDNLLDKICIYDYIENRRAYSFLLVGKKGTGKTFLVDNVVKMIFPGSNFIKINMLDYQSVASFAKIVGHSPEYVDFNNHYLFSSIKENPFSIILVDHVEKGNSFILKQLFHAFHLGYILDSKGEKIILSKCIVFFTSTVVESSLGFVSKSLEDNFVDFSFDSVLYFDDVSKKQFVSCFYEKFQSENKFSNIAKRDISFIWDKLDYEHDGFHKLNRILEEEYSISF